MDVMICTLRDKIVMDLKSLNGDYVGDGDDYNYGNFLYWDLWWWWGGDGDYFDGDNGDGDDYDYGDSLYCDYGDDDDNVMVMIAIYCDDVVEMGMRQQVLWEEAPIASLRNMFIGKQFALDRQKWWWW